jgi:hypothetical protein
MIPHSNTGILMSVSPTVAPIANIIDIIDHIQTAISNYFTITDLAYVFCLILISTASQLQFTFTFKEEWYKFP